MNALSLENINQNSPYLVCAASEPGYYEFNTDYGVEYVLGFMPDDLLHSDETYQFLITIEGETNYASLLIRNDNPRLTDVILEFTETIRLLSAKPDERI